MGINLLVLYLEESGDEHLKMHLEPDSQQLQTTVWTNAALLMFSGDLFLLEDVVAIIPSYQWVKFSLCNLCTI